MAKSLLPGRLGPIVLGIYLILIGILALAPVFFAGIHIIAALLAIVAGVLLIMGR
jgi:hypothetical protein